MVTTRWVDQAADRVWRRSVGAVALAGLVLLSRPASPAGADSPYAFGPRGTGAAARSEGVKREDYAGALSLLSFTFGPTTSLRNSQPRDLRVQFFVDRPLDGRIRVREITAQKSYLLEAKGPWSVGDQTFVWPTAEVIDPLEVNVDNLGVVRLRTEYSRVSRCAGFSTEVGRRSPTRADRRSKMSVQRGAPPFPGRPPSLATSPCPSFVTKHRQRLLRNTDNDVIAR